MSALRTPEAALEGEPSTGASDAVAQPSSPAVTGENESDDEVTCLGSASASAAAKRKAMSPPVDAVARASAGGASKRVRRATVAATDEELTADESDAAERVEADAEAETEWMERKKEKLLSLQSTTIRQKKIMCLQLFNELIDHMTTREPAALSVGDGSDESSDADSRSGSGSSECDDDNDDDYHESRTSKPRTRSTRRSSPEDESESDGTATTKSESSSSSSAASAAPTRAGTTLKSNSFTPPSATKPMTRSPGAAAAAAPAAAAAASSSKRTLASKSSDAAAAAGTAVSPSSPLSNLNSKSSPPAVAAAAATPSKRKPKPTGPAAAAAASLSSVPKAATKSAPPADTAASVKSAPKSSRFVGAPPSPSTKGTTPGPVAALAPAVSTASPAKSKAKQPAAATTTGAATSVRRGTSKPPGAAAATTQTVAAATSKSAAAKGKPEATADSTRRAPTKPTKPQSFSPAKAVSGSKMPDSGQTCISSYMVAQPAAETASEKTAESGVDLTLSARDNKHTEHPAAGAASSTPIHVTDEGADATTAGITSDTNVGAPNPSPTELAADSHSGKEGATTADASSTSSDDATETSDATAPAPNTFIGHDEPADEPADDTASQPLPSSGTTPPVDTTTHSTPVVARSLQFASGTAQGGD